MSTENTEKLTDSIEKLKLSLEDDKKKEYLKQVTQQIDLDNPKSITEIFNTIIFANHEFNEQAVNKPTPDNSILFQLVSFSEKNRKAFLKYITTAFQDGKDSHYVQLSKIYSSLKSHSDHKLSALSSIYSTLDFEIQRKLVEFSLNSIKVNSKTLPLSVSPTLLLDLQIISRYFINITSNNPGSTFHNQLSYVIDNRSKILSLIAPFSDRRLTTAWISPVVLILAKLFEIDSAGTEVAVHSLIEDYLITGDHGSQVEIDSLIISFSLNTILFHINKDVGYSVFTSEAMVSQQAEFAQQKSGSPLTASEQVVVAALDLLSAACVHKDARAIIKSKFLNVVNYALEFSGKKSVSVIAASILVKTEYGGDKDAVAAAQAKQKDPNEPPKEESEEDTVDLKSLSKIFEEEIAIPFKNEDNPDDDKFIFKKNEDSISKEVYGTALEGLAFTSLIPETKMRIAGNASILNNLVTILEKYNSEIPWVYCTLSILDNITVYPPKLTPEQEKISKLKDYAAGKTKQQIEELNSAGGKRSGPTDTDQTVAARCKKIITTTKLISALSQYTPKFTQTCKNLTASILRNLATDKTTRSKFVQEGGLSVLLYLVLPIDNSSTNSSMSEEKDNSPNWSNYRVDPKHLVIATSGISRILISINPAIAFSSKISPVVVIRPLLLQLKNSGLVGGFSGLQSSSSFSSLPLLDIFEALLALTNIASIDDSCRNTIVRLGWSKLEALLTSDNTMVQRAAVELLCNLAPSPYCAEKFLDLSKDKRGPALSRLQLVAALTDLDDLAGRKAAAGALAMISEWGVMAGIAMIQCDRLVERLEEMLEQETNSDVLIRGLVTLQNLISSNLSDKDPQNATNRTKFLNRMKKNLPAKLKALSSKTKDPEVKEIVSEILGIL